MYPKGGSLKLGIKRGSFSGPYYPKRTGYFPSFPDRVLNPC